jgi:ribosomal protein S18 acetylase RimI-like enzyme
MDSLLDYVYDSRKYPLSGIPRPATAPDVLIRAATDADEDPLVELARLSFQEHFGRFHTDPHIPRAQATELYAEWIRSCCHGYADWVRVAEVNGALAGVAAWKKPAALALAHGLRVGHLSIVGIHPHYAGRGLFSALTYEGTFLLEGVADYISGPTHINNYPVQRGYDKLRWRIFDAQHAFHKWLKA